MTKYSELDPTAQTALRDRLSVIEGRVHAAMKDLNTLSYRYLFLVHSGGSIAVLGFIGSQNSLGSRPTFTVICLASFATGVAICGVLLFLMRGHAIDEVTEHEKITAQVMSGQMTIEAFIARYSPQGLRARYKNWRLAATILQCAAYSLFIAGLVFGAVAVWPSSGAQGATLPS